jgi:hypothetical protein
MKDLFGNEIGQPEKQPKMPENHRAIVAHKKLLQLHGITEGKKCKDCDLCYRYQQSKTWYKCSLFSTSGTVATDWRANWQACGKFKKETDERNP